MSRKLQAFAVSMLLPPPSATMQSNFSRCAAAQHAAEPRQVEHGFDEDDAAERRRRLHADHRHERQRHVPQEVCTHDASLARPLRSRCAHVLLAQLLDHERADHHREQRRVDDAEGDPRQHQVLRPAREAVATRRDVVHAAVAARRQHIQPVAEEVAEHEPEQHRVHRQADHDEERRSSVEHRPRPEGGQHAERDRDQQPDEEAAGDQRQGDRGRLDEPRRHLLPGAVRPAQVAVADEPPDEVGVLPQEAAVEPVFGRRPAGEPRVVPRHHEERDEDEQGDGEEQEDVCGDPPDHKAAHLSRHYPAAGRTVRRVYDGSP